MSTTNRRALALIVLAAVVAAVLLGRSQTEQEPPRQERGPGPKPLAPAELRTAGENPAPSTQADEPAPKGQASRTILTAVNLRGRPIQNIALDVPATISSVKYEPGPSPGSLIVTWSAKADGSHFPVTSPGHLPRQLKLGADLGPAVVVTLEGDAEIGVRRIDVRAYLPDGRYASGAEVTATSKDGRVLTGTTNALGELRFDTGDEMGSEWTRVAVVWRDRFENEYRLGRGPVWVPSDLPMTLNLGAQAVVICSLDDAIPLPKHDAIIFTLVSLDSGQSQGRSGQSHRRSARLTASMPGRYRVLARLKGRLLGQTDVDIAGPGDHHVTVVPATTPDLVCTLTPDLAARFGSLLVFPQSLVKAASLGAMDKLEGWAMSGMDPLDTVWIKGRITRIKKISGNDVRCALPERENCRIYVLDKEGGLLARANADIGLARGGAVHLDLPRDADPLSSCHVTLGGDLGPLARDADMTVSLWDRVGYRHNGPVSLKGRNLVLPSLPSGTYSIRFGKQLKDRYIFPVTPYSIEYPAPPSTGRVRWLLIWPQ